MGERERIFCARWKKRRRNSKEGGVWNLKRHPAAHHRPKKPKKGYLIFFPYPQVSKPDNRKG